jgi:colanic acid biosynthesis glycosyl transferase WcaI
MTQKRILVVCQHYWPESFRINDICDYFVDQGIEVDVLCGIPNYPQGKFYGEYGYFKNRHQIHNGVRIRRVFEIPRGRNSNFGIFLNNISFPIASLFHLPWLLSQKYDQVFIYQLSPVMMALPGIIVGKIKKIKITMWSIDPWPESLYSFLRVRTAVLRKLTTVVSHWHYRHVDKLIVLSDRIRKTMIKTSALNEQNVIVLPMACEKIYEEEIHDKALAKRFKDGFNIVFAGTITPIISLETALEATSILKERGITDLNWIIVGDGMGRQGIEKEVKKRGLTNNFFFEGLKPKDEIPKYTTIADALYSSLVKSDFLEATIPAKIPSYLPAGKPIILSMNGAAIDLINKIGCGLTSPAQDAQKLADNIEKLYAMSPTQRAKMGAKARTFHFKYFERNLVLQKLLNYIQS